MQTDPSLYPSSKAPNLTTTRKPERKIVSNHFWPKFPLTAEQCRNVTFVTTASNGRLGNRIGEYITLFSYGRRYRKIPVVIGDLLEELRPLFPQLRLASFNETGCLARRWSYAGIDAYGQVMKPWNQTEFVEKRDVCLYAYPIDFALFHQYRDDWIPDFTFNSLLVKQVQSFLTAVSIQYGRNLTYVGIHVRLTDQTKAYHDKFGADPLSPEYFRRAMNLFGLMFPRVVFVLASDDIGWCKRNVRSFSKNLPIVPQGRVRSRQRRHRMVQAKREELQ
ncbi:unnamed protein product [Darwinula stevensoni]|uniref:L-Fucosyltransferase n=1 Tax=Darwinula stevensoni TaxID=69355 RepID=A0A7R9FSQ0_9CRUS|nr:unnamed protein product [Darwinula stevensoni]CAG0904245.1 unnamed protein product [Darwinula stevensoni]